MFQKYKYHLIALLAAITIIIGIAIQSLEKPKMLGVFFYDVGEGDATLIETPSRDQILVDGGPNSTVVQKVGRDMPFYDRKIELVILTHPDSDHLRGLVEVLKRYDVDMILTPDIDCDTSICREWDNVVKDKNIPVTNALAGQEVVLGENLVINILSAGDGKADDNLASLVFRLDFEESSFLFTGDANKDIEKKLISSGAIIDTDVLKVGHHGSKTSTMEDFLKSVTPDVAVISVGKNNRYGHPADEIIDRLNSFGVEIFRTDQSGDIRIFSDGESLTIQ